MRSLLLSILLMFLVAVQLAGNFAGPQRPIPPGLHEGEKRINAPLDRPVILPGKNIDPARLHDEAAELARLSVAIPAQIQQINQGQMPKDLGDQLKRIEKLAKHLRSEITP
jgi:hypothetical protein